MGELTLAEVLELLADKAKALRDAGVRRLELEGLTVELAAAEPTIIVQASRAERESADPLDDPMTFGGQIPSFRRPRDEDDT